MLILRQETLRIFFLLFSNKQPEKIRGYFYQTRGICKETNPSMKMGGISLSTIFCLENNPGLIQIISKIDGAMAAN